MTSPYTTMKKDFMKCKTKWKEWLEQQYWRVLGMQEVGFQYGKIPEKVEIPKPTLTSVFWQYLKTGTPTAPNQGS